MPPDPRAIIVLGMHRSGTSCLAGMLAAGGLASAGEAVRNWDNARGHHENLDAVRLNEAVLAYSGGHWLLQPAEVRWTDEHAAARDRLLTAEIDGRAALLKDPRTLLALPFWRASPVPFHVIGIVRHPLSVARSLESWRGMPLAEGVALWSAHNRVLADDHVQHGYPLVDFEARKPAVVAAVIAACASIMRSSATTVHAGALAVSEEQVVHHDGSDVPEVPRLDEAALAAGYTGHLVAHHDGDVREVSCLDETALAAAYEEQLVHHDDGDVPSIAGLDEAIALYRQLTSAGPSDCRRPFPRAEVAAFERQLRDGAIAAAMASARSALAAVDDAAAVLVPIVTTLVRHRAFVEAQRLIAEHASRLDEGLADLLQGKVLLALGDGVAASQHLAAACAVPRPFFQARHLLPQALRAAGRHAAAREALTEVAREALYPHGPLATLAEWSWLDGERDEALRQMQQAIAAAPPHRRGRLRTRRAEWLVACGESSAARDELARAIDEDPGYARSREVLARIS